MVFQLIHRVSCALTEGIAASFVPVKAPVVPLLNADGGKHGVPEIAVAAVVDYVLPDNHTQPVALIVEFLRLDFDVLAQGVEAETLHGEDIIGIAFRGGGGEQPLRPVALIQQTVEEIGFAVETQAGIFAYLFDFQRPDGKVGFHLILRRFHGEAVKIGVVRAPEMGIFRGDGHLPVFQRELPQLLHADGSVQGRNRGDRHGRAVIFDVQLLYIDIRHAFQPHRLPDTGHGGVPHAAPVHHLLAVGESLIVEIVGAADDQLVFLRQRFGDVHAEGGIAALVAAQVLPVHEHLCNLIGSADVEQHPLPAEALGQKKASAIP